MTAYEKIRFDLIDFCIDFVLLQPDIVFRQFIKTSWLSETTITDPLIKNLKQIPLSNRKYLNDSFKSNVTIWNFKEGLLTINYWDVVQQKETLITTYKYLVDRQKGILTIYFEDNVQLYKVGITSTGKNAPGIEIKKGLFTVHHFGGSNDRWLNNISFQYSPTLKAWYQYKIVDKGWNVFNLDKVEKHVQTKQNFGVVSFEKYNCENSSYY